MGYVMQFEFLTLMFTLFKKLRFTNACLHYRQTKCFCVFSVRNRNRTFLSSCISLVMFLFFHLLYFYFILTSNVKIVVRSFLLDFSMWKFAWRQLMALPVYSIVWIDKKNAYRVLLPLDYVPEVGFEPTHSKIL